MTNRARTEYDTAFSSQLPNNISAPSIDIPQFHGSNNFQGNDFGGSKEGSTHTTPLNYMTRSTPSSSIRKVEQIREIDPYHGGEIGDDFEIDRRFNTMNLSSGASDDFFQLQNGNNDALQELEPIEQNRAVKGQDVPLQPPNNHNWTGNDQTLISEKGDNPRYRDILVSLTHKLYCCNYFSHRSKQSFY